MIFTTHASGGAHPIDRAPGRGRRDRCADRHAAPSIDSVSPPAEPVDPSPPTPPAPGATAVRARPRRPGGRRRPSGSSCAYWLAEAGWDVALVEKKVFPREKTCGDGLTPRSVRQIADMGIEGALAGAHRYGGLRAHAFGRVLDLPWPEHPSLPLLRLRHHPPRPRRPGQRAGGQGRRHACARGRRPSSRSSTATPPGRRAPDSRRAWGRWSRTRPPERSARCAPATWWWPTAPTRGSAGRSGRAGTVASRWAWRCAATTRPPATTSPSSSPTSTSGTATATSCPATAGSSRSATAG